MTIAARGIILALLLTLLAGCATEPPRPAAVWSLDGNRPYIQPGTGGIVGQAFTRTQGGDVKFAAWRTVYLLPATPYYTDWTQRSVNARGYVGPMDTDAVPYIRQTVADDEGNFTFSGLPAGNYIVYTELFWKYHYNMPSGDDGTVIMGGPLTGTVSVTEGQTIPFILN